MTEAPSASTPPRLHGRPPDARSGFWAELAEANLRETAAGRIVLAPACDMKTPHRLWADERDAEELKVRLDELHRAKLRMADEVLVVNVNLRLGSPSTGRRRHLPRGPWSA